MATVRPLPAPVTDQGNGIPASADEVALGAGNALVPVSRPLEDDEESAFRGPVARLPVEVDVSVPVRDFRVRDLLALAPGRVIESQWDHGSDLPLAAGDVQLAQSEFEVVETRLAVRVTRLA